MLLSLNVSYSQMRNYKIIDSLLSKHIDELQPELLNNKMRCFNLETNLKDIDFLIENKLLEKYPGISFHRNIYNQCPTLKINTNNIEVNYVFVENDTVNRRITVELTAIIEPKNEPMRLIHKQNYEFNDQIKLEDIDKLQKSPYQFDKGEIPEEESTFYDSYLQPIIFIGTAIITIAILFTVRSSWFSLNNLN